MFTEGQSPRIQYLRTYRSALVLLELQIYQARNIMANNGTVSIRVLRIHQIAESTPLLWICNAFMIVARAAMPLPDDTARARSPRLRQPRVSTGVAAITKKSSGMIPGNNTCRTIFSILCRKLHMSHHRRDYRALVADQDIR